MGVPPAAISKSRRKVNSCFRKKPAAAAATAALQRTSTKPNPTRNRMDRRAPKWGELPALAISNIYDYLDVNDVHIASSTCWHWRSVLFQKRWVTTINSFVLSMFDFLRLALVLRDGDFDCLTPWSGANEIPSRTDSLALFIAKSPTRKVLPARPCHWKVCRRQQFVE